MTYQEIESTECESVPVTASGRSDSRPEGTPAAGTALVDKIPKAAVPICQALQLLIEPGRVFEIRALGCKSKYGGRPHVRRGYFDYDHIAEAARSALELTLPTTHSGWEASGVYLTLNPVNPDLHSRCCNRVDRPAEKGASTEDGDILNRRWLMIDIDPKRTSGVSSSDSELEASRLIGQRIVKTLTEECSFPEPAIIANSGNGWHILYRIDLPNDDASSNLLKTFLAALNYLFGDKSTGIDTKVFDAVRICKLYGTVSRKGDHTEARPHRRSAIIRSSENPKEVPPEAIREFVRKNPVDDSPRNGTHRPRQSVGSSPSVGRRSGQSAFERAERYALSVEPAISGSNGSGVTYRLTCELVRGFDLTDSQALEILTTYNERCEPPWSETELRHKIDEARSKADGEPGYLLNRQIERDGVTREQAASVEFLPFDGATTVTAAAGGDGVDWTDEFSEHGQTDIANAGRLRKAFRGEVIWVLSWARFFAWDGMRFADDGGLQVELRCKLVAGELWQIGYAEEDRKRAESLLRFAAKSSSSMSVSAMSKLVRSEPGIAIPHTDLDSDPWLLNCRNGILDLRTGELMAHHPGFKITKLCPTSYNKNATCENFERFLQSVFVVPELIEFVQRLVGYCLTGLTSEQILTIFYGTGSNGKSKLIEAIGHTMGSDYGGTAARGLLEEKPGQSHPTELADLYGKRFVVSSETDDGCGLAEGLVKQLTGGDPIAARRMRQDFWTFIPTHKLILCTNHRPRVSGTDHGIWRRLVLVPFDVTFWNPEKGESGPEELRQDKAIGEKLKSEAEGILAWAVRGCLEWQRTGLRIPESVRAATNQYRTESDVIGQFLEAACITGATLKVKAKDLFAAYGAWCDENGYRATSQRKFGEALTVKGFERATIRITWYRGIGLREPSEDSPEVSEPCSGSQFNPNEFEPF